MRTDRLLASSLSIAVASSLHAQTHVYVDDDAPAGGDGMSWNSAFCDLHDAIDLATQLGMNRGEIRIAGGVYTPDRGTGDRTMAFSVPGARAGEPLFRMFGGFAGLANQGAPDTRNRILYRTTISGDLGDDDLPGGVNISENAERLVVVGHAGAVARSAVSGIALDGIGFRGATSHAVQSVFPKVSAVFSNCEFVDNHGLHGSALNLTEATVLLSASTFRFNTSIEVPSHPYAAGAVNANTTRLEVVSCLFESNIAKTGSGGGIAATGSFVTVWYSVFRDNDADEDGGAIFCNADANIRTSMFVGNTAAHNGGAICIVGMADDCRFESNTAGFNGGGAFIGEGTILVNCDFIQNTARSGGGVAGAFDDTRIHYGYFIENSATDNGGGACRVETIGRARFINNTAGREGGAIAFAGRVWNSDIEENHARRGGGIFNADEISTCLLSQNTAGAGSAVYLSINSNFVISDSVLYHGDDTVGALVWKINGSPLDIIRSTLVRSGEASQAMIDVNRGFAWIESSIIWDFSESDVPTFKFGSGASAVMMHTNTQLAPGDIQMYSPGDVQFFGSNYGSDPLFTDPIVGDLSLTQNSPSIDAWFQATIYGLPYRDVVGNLREPLDDSGIINRGVGLTDYLDIGALEFQGTSCPADVNNDGSLTQTDFTAWIAAYNSGSSRADQNRDGIIDQGDFTAWINNYTTGCP